MCQLENYQGILRHYYYIVMYDNIVVLFFFQEFNFLEIHAEMFMDKMIQCLGLKKL